MAGTGGELGTGDDEVRGLPRPPTSTHPMGGVVRGVWVGEAAEAELTRARKRRWPRLGRAKCGCGALTPMGQKGGRPSGCAL